MDTGNTREEIRDLAERLGDLVKVDVAAVEACSEAIERIEAEPLRTQLSQFRDDHQRHVRELTQAIQTMGSEVPKQSPDMKGKLIEGMTAMRSAMGDEQALKAMRQNEVVTNHAYEDALQDHTWPGEIQSLLDRGLADERRHLQWVEDQLTVTTGATTERSTY